MDCKLLVFTEVCRKKTKAPKIFLKTLENFDTIRLPQYSNDKILTDINFTSIITSTKYNTM